MAVCSKCEQDMSEADKCDDQRTITFWNGEEMDPIPFGEGDRTVTYQELVERYEKDIENGGRGKLGPAYLREELEEIKEQWTEEAYNNRRCHSCGVKTGEIHHPGCDTEECPHCRRGRQLLSCPCMTEEEVEKLLRL